MTVIVVTGTRLVHDDGSSYTRVSAHMFQGSVPGNTSEGQDISAPREFRRQLDRLEPTDKVIIDFDGMKIVIDGQDTRGYFATATATVITILNGVMNGTLESTLSSLSGNTRTFIDDLIGDIVDAAVEGRFIRFTNVANLGREADDYWTDHNITENDLAFTVDRIIEDTGDIDHNTATTGYHQIVFDTGNINTHSPSVPGTRVNVASRNFVSLDVLIAHELGHISDSAADLRSELLALGIENEEDDDVVMNRVADSLIKIFEDQETDFDFDRMLLRDPVTVSGSEGNETISRMFQQGESLTVLAGGGYDFIEIEAQPATIQTGVGNDKVHLREGDGFVGLYNEGGSDRLYIKESSLADTTVERFGDWIYVGFQTDGTQANQNRSASETDSFIYWQIGHGPDSVKIEGVFYTENDLLAMANSKPYSLIGNLVRFEMDKPAGNIGVFPAWDSDGDTITYSIISVTGTGASEQWDINASAQISTSFSWEFQGNIEFTTVTVRASDGEFYEDYDVAIIWSGEGPMNAPPPGDGMGDIDSSAFATGQPRPEIDAMMTLQHEPLGAGPPII